MTFNEKSRMDKNEMKDMAEQTMSAATYTNLDVDELISPFNQSLSASTPTQTPEKAITAPFNTSLFRNTSSISENTPNRSGGASSRHSLSFRSQPSPKNSTLKSFDSSFADNSVRQERSRDKRHFNTPVCLGDFIGISSRGSATGLLFL